MRKVIGVVLAALIAAVSAGCASGMKDDGMMKSDSMAGDGSNSGSEPELDSGSDPDFYSGSDPDFACIALRKSASVRPGWSG